MSDSKPVAQETQARTEAALLEGLSEVQTSGEAAEVLDQLEQAAGGLREEEVANGAPVHSAATPSSPAAAVVQTAGQIATAQPDEKPPLDQAVVEVTGGPDGQTSAEMQNSRRLLRRELFRRLKPFDALDSTVFVEINHLPHPPLLDRFFSRLSWIMTGGIGWFLLLVVNCLIRPRNGWRALLGVAPSLWLATSTVEYPIKKFFRRRRPFLTLLQAVVVGRKPGSFSFPSGHSAAAFAGAVLLARHLPKGRKSFFLLAGLVAFSRIFLGAHYPGDVLSGSLLGGFLARFYVRLLEKIGFPALPPRQRKN